MNAVEEKAAQAAFFVTGVQAQGRLPSLFALRLATVRE
jgi:hypothetical protein